MPKMVIQTEEKNLKGSLNLSTKNSKINLDHVEILSKYLELDGKSEETLKSWTESSNLDRLRDACECFMLLKILS